MTVLSVNLNKIAVLRNARGETEPDIAAAANTCIEAGCGGITVHPRPDHRHITPDDVLMLAKLTRGRVEYNMEGNPFAGAREGYPGFIELVRQARPTQATLVPDAEGQVTSDHGFDLARDAERLAPLVRELNALGCRVSLFMDPGSRDLEVARQLGAARIEIYTGPYAKAFRSGDFNGELARCVETAQHALRTGLAVNAGHDLNQQNLATLQHAIADLAEVSIGHALIGEALYEGLAATVRNYLRILDSNRRP